MWKNMLIGLVGIMVGVMLSTVVVLAGNLDPSSGPTTASSQMYTLEQVYDRLDTGAAATKMLSFVEPSSGPTVGTMYTLDDLYDLVGERAPVPKTGQTTSYTTGDDGDLEKGVAWPSPRFANNGNGTVTDNLTGLIWLQNANCFGTRNWSTALSDASSLESGSCGLTDGSSAGDWRLPNVRELYSLIDFSQHNPALSSGHPFTSVQSYYYWASTTSADGTPYAWFVRLYNGTVSYTSKASTYYVWPVRGGQ